MYRTSMVRPTLILLAAYFLVGSELLRSQTSHLPIETAVRKSFLGGSYVLQVHNSSNEKLNLWIEAKERMYTFTLPPGQTKDIGWAQGLRFDANDAFFISGNGFDTLKQVMPSEELSPWRLGFSNDGGLAINLSQSFLQKRLPNYIKLPVEQSYSNIVNVAVTDIPQIVLNDGSDRIYASVYIHTTWLSGKARIPMNMSVSFVPRYDSHTGKLYASSIKLENVDVRLIPKHWLNDFTEAVNKLLPALFNSFEIFQLDKTLLKYARFMNVRRLVIRDGRLEIHFL